MPIPIVNSIASWMLKKRMHQMELFIKYPNEVQEELLMNLIDKAKNTEIGQKYHFNEIKGHDDYRKRVPIRTYEDYAEMIDRSRNGENNIFWPTPVKMFAKSSGTTNAKSKFIPLSQEALENNHYACGKDLLCLYLNNNEDASLFTGKSLRLGGSKNILKNKGTSYGDLSALMIDNSPFWASFSSTPSNEVSLMSDWEKKLEAITKESVEQNVTSMAGVPSWMLVLLNHILEKTGKSNLLEIWPDLEVYFHGGVSFDPYLKEYQDIIPRSDFKYYEIFNASEGFFACQDQNGSKDLLLMLDYGIFYEFIPMDVFGTADQKAIPLSEVEKGKNYAIVITTNSGLWRYQVGDTVRFTSTDPYRIRITGRTKHYINVFGEELIIENAEEALRNVTHQFNLHIKDYTVGPVFMEGKEKGAHEWIIEFEKDPEDKDAFKAALDECLQKVNSDYEAKRANDTTLKELKLNIANKGLFYEWLRRNDKLGGQHKIPRLSNKRDYVEELLKINDEI